MPRLRLRITVRVLNAQGVSERAPWDEVEAGIRKPSPHGGQVDVWLLSEVAWADLSAIAARHGLYALQYGERGSAEAGVGILSRVPMTPLAPVVGSRATREGGGIRMRPLVGARMFRVAFRAIHVPPKRAPIAQTAYFARIRASRGVIGGDFNESPRWMRRSFVRKYRGIGVLGLLVPRRFKASKALPVDVGSDHFAADVVLHVSARRR